MNQQIKYLSPLFFLHCRISGKVKMTQYQIMEYYKERLERGKADGGGKWSTTYKQWREKYFPKTIIGNLPK